MSIYRTQEGRRQVLRLYDAQLQALGTPFEDRWVETSFARTHLVEVGAKENPPLFVLHGGNATTACNLLNCHLRSRSPRASGQEWRAMPAPLWPRLWKVGR